MKLKIDDKEYNVIIIKKNNKNTYVRVDKDLNIVVTTNYLMPKYKINKILNDNIKSIKKMIVKKEKIDNNFYYLGKKYDIIINDNIKATFISNDAIFTKSEKELNKWLKKETEKLFKDRLNKMYNLFDENIPYPALKIRNMKSRWGVCNKKGYITLNSNLIKYNISEIDYVIIHELSHYVHFNHSKEFWKTVSKYYPNYKKSKKVLNGSEA